MWSARVLSEQPGRINRTAARTKAREERVAALNFEHPKADDDDGSQENF